MADRDSEEPGDGGTSPDQLRPDDLEAIRTGMLAGGRPISTIRAIAPTDEVSRSLNLLLAPRWHVEVDIGRSEREDLGAFLAGITRSARAVCLIRTAAGNGTGFMIDASTVITNNHVFTGDPDVLAGRGDAESATAVFGYENDTDGRPKATSEYTLAPVQGFLASLDLDYAVSRVSGDPGSTWGWLRLPDSNDLAVGDDVYVIQHPRGLPKQISFAANTVTAMTDDRVQYTADTLRGSSGAPVFDRRWSLVAVHHANVLVTDPAGREVTRNQGVLAPVIRDDLARAGWTV